MELLDRYLQAIQKHLPKRGQQDIIAELRANLESQLEDKEAEASRPLTTEEQEAWLKQLGSPMQVAARYQSPQYLIGPTVFPYFRFVLEKALALCALVYAIVNAILIALNTPTLEAVIGAILRFPGVAMTTAAWVTLVFVALELAAPRYPGKLGALENWKPTELPPLQSPPSGGGKERSYAAAVANVLVGFGFLIYLLLVPRHPFLLLGPGAYVLRELPYRLAPVWMTFYWGIVALNVLQLAWNSIALLRGKWNRRHPAEHLLSKAGGVALLVLLINTKDHAYVALKHPALDQLRYGDTLSEINKNVHLALRIGLAVAAVTLAWEVAQVVMAAYRDRNA